MINIAQIKPGMPVVCSEDGQFAVVDHMEGPDTIKLKKDKAGQHHYIPLSWVTSIENGKVKIDRPGDQAMREWSTTSQSASPGKPYTDNRLAKSTQNETRDSKQGRI